MRHKTRHPLFLSLLAVALVLGGPTTGAISGAAEPQADDEEVFIYDDKGQRDPFWPLVTPSGAIITHEKDLTASDLVLEGILVENDGNNAVIINGRILNVDDAIGPFVIIRIAADYVMLQKGKQVFTLKLKKEE